MIKTFDCSEIAVEDIILREQQTINEAVEKTVAEILEDVRRNGDEALFRYCEKFDGARLSSLLVSAEEIDEAYAAADEAFIETLEKAKANIVAFHSRQKRNGFTLSENDGIVLGQRVIALERVGLYVPGGTAAYPSSVLMDTIPAKIAGVSEIAIATPPDKMGKINPAILTAAKVAGVTTIYKMGGAQAIAALAYGTESVKKVDKIVGPGNIYVSTAKRRVFGSVDIDMVAGPSEILVLADETANADYVAADMLSQAEHDKNSSAVLVCDSASLAKKVSESLEGQIEKLPRKEIARASVDNNGKIIVVKNLKEAVRISNLIAPEHLELCVDDPFSLLSLVVNAGCVFMGKNVPEALGDYFAGTNHTLPTGGTARFSSPLSVDDFIKTSNYVYYTKKALSEVKDDVASFAKIEGLDGHAKSVLIRFDE